MFARLFRSRPRARDEWSIGLVQTDSPLNVSGPIQWRSPSSLGDGSAQSFADPFLFQRGKETFLFYESLRADSGKGRIAVAQVTAVGVKFLGIAIQEAFHLSYPFVFHWNGEVVLMPESAQSGSQRFYRAVDFPLRWEALPNSIPGEFADASLIEFEGKWWTFAATREGKRWVLSLYFADSPLGPWKPHPRNPIRRSPPRTCRPAGRPMLVDGSLIILTQDCRRRYGHQVWAHRITKITEQEYEECRLARPVLTASGTGANAHGMHHLDAVRLPNGQWLCAVDGVREVQLSQR